MDSTDIALIAIFGFVLLSVIATIVFVIVEKIEKEKDYRMCENAKVRKKR